VTESTGRPVVLLFVWEAAREHVLAAGLVGRVLESCGARPVFILCDASLTACEHPGENQPAVCAGCTFTSISTLVQLGFSEVIPARSLLKSGEREALIEEMSGLGYAELLRSRIADLPLGELINYSLRNHLRVEIPPVSTPALPLWRRYAAAARIQELVTARAFEQYRPRGAFMLNAASFSKRIVFEMARKADIRALTQEWHGPARKISLQADQIVRLYGFDDQPFEEIPFSDEDYQKARAEFETRVELVQGKNKSVSGSTLPAELLSKYDKVIPLYPTLGWELLPQGSARAFHDQLDWIQSAIEYAQLHPNFLLVIRTHPSEVRLRDYPSAESAADRILCRWPVLPSNVLLVRPEERLDSYELVRSSDVVLVHSSTVGIEASCLGTPAVVTADIYYRGKGFTFDVARRRDFDWVVDRAIHAGGLTEEQRRAAFKMLYLRVIGVASCFFELPHLVRGTMNDLPGSTEARKLGPGDARLALPTVEAFEEEIPRRMGDLVSFLTETLSLQPEAGGPIPSGDRWGEACRAALALARHHTERSEVELARACGDLAIVTERGDRSFALYGDD
jgi:hypothetical protein